MGRIFFYGVAKDFEAGSFDCKSQNASPPSGVRLFGVSGVKVEEIGKSLVCELILDDWVDCLWRLLKDLEPGRR